MKIQNTSIFYLKNKSSIQCRKCCWEFKFENMKLDSAVIDSYKNIVEDYKKEYFGIENILRNKKFTKDLRNTIRNRYGNIFNRTSIVLLHRPIASDTYVQFGFCDYCFCRHLYAIIQFPHLFQSPNSPISFVSFVTTAVYGSARATDL